MTHRGPFQPLLFCDSVLHRAAVSIFLLYYIQRYSGTDTDLNISVFISKYSLNIITLS